MNHDLLLMGPLLPSVMQTLESTYRVFRYWESDNPQALLEQIKQSCKALVTDGGTGVQATTLEQLPNVGIVSVFGVGVDAVDTDYCNSRSISVTNTPDVLSDDVADMAVGLALAVSRQLVFGDRYARAERWTNEGAMPLTRRLTGKRAGIYGMGSIGEALAKRLEGFAMSINYCNRNERANSPYNYFASLTEMAARIDYLFVTASANPGTAGSINAPVLDALGEQGYLVNVSRGTLVDEPTLVKYLQENRIAGAGLDVFSAEPRIPDELFSLDNVVLQPHNASGTWETREAMGDLVIRNLEAYFANKSLLTLVNG